MPLIDELLFDQVDFQRKNGPKSVSQFYRTHRKTEKRQPCLYNWNPSLSWPSKA